MTEYTGLMHDFLTRVGYYDLEMNALQRIGIALGVIIFSSIVYTVCLKIIVPLVHKITSTTTVKWDDYLLSSKVMKSACQVIFFTTIYIFIPLAFNDDSILLPFVIRIAKVLIIATIAKLITSFISSLSHMSKEHDNLGKKPLQGVYQMLNIIVLCITVILIVSELFDKNPSVLLTGLGASAAIVMLVFKDSILGLVAGIQLSVNDMLRPGDWIEMKKYGADGVVIEISLTTIKVRNWDNTIVTLPPYVLVSDSFQNWRGMEESGGRRIKRHILIDMNTIRFCTEQEIAYCKEKGWIENTDKEERVSNLTAFRSYVETYLTNNDKINSNLTVMVRQMQPTAEGLPLELYCFSKIKSFKPYEKVQAEVFEHIFSVIPEFGLKVFQTPSGNDIHILKKA